MGKPNIGYGRGARLRALDEQTLVPPCKAKKACAAPRCP